MTLKFDTKPQINPYGYHRSPRKIMENWRTRKRDVRFMKDFLNGATLEECQVKYSMSNTAAIQLINRMVKDLYHFVEDRSQVPSDSYYHLRAVKDTLPFWKEILEKNEEEILERYRQALLPRLGRLPDGSFRAVELK